MFKLTVLILCIILSSHLVFAKEEKREQEHENPTWTFKVDKTKGSAPLLVTFDASSIRPAKKFYWSFGNGDTLVTNKSILSYQYKLPGTYTASLKFAVEANEKDLKELKNAGRKTITATNFPPIANLACSANYLLINCNGLGSIDPENQPLQYTFTYADGFTETNSTGLSSHAFLLAGLYNVQLTVKDVFGLTSSSSISVQALRPPNKLPVLALNCFSDKINILKCDAIGSNDLDGTIASFSYAWDDGASDSKADTAAIEHTFSAPGAHSVILTAVDNDGGVSTLSKSFSVKADTNPIANFTCDNSKPQKLTCHSTSKDPDAGDTIQSYSWKFGTSAVSTMTPDVDYSFSAGGNVVVSLSVTDSYGGSNTLVQTVAVKENQVPTFDLEIFKLTGDAPLADSFKVLNVNDADGSISLVEWFVNSERVGTGGSLDYTFSNVGTYTVKARVTDDLGGYSEKLQSIDVLEAPRVPPRAFFKYFLKGTQVELHATLTRTQFDFDRAYYTIDGSKTVSLNEFYPNTINTADLLSYGMHTIELTVVDKRGQVGKFSHQVNALEDVNQSLPYVGFNYSQANVRTIFFNFNPSFNPDLIFGIKNYHISYGDGTSADITNDTFATHQYLAAGDYDVSLTITTGQGTKATIVKKVTVSDADFGMIAPVASFGYRIYDWAQNVTFNNETSGTPNGEIISYLWDFGDGSTGTGASTNHFYNPGDYFVTLTVVDSAGMQSSQTQHIKILAPGNDLVANVDCSVTLTQGPVVTCKTIVVDKYNQVNYARVYWGDGTSSGVSGGTTSHKYSSSGNFTITLLAGNSRGESAMSTTSFQVVLPNPIAKINCSQDNLALLCNTGGSYDPSGFPLVAYNFNTGDSFETGFSSQGNFRHEYSNPGAYTVTATIKSSTGQTAIATYSANMVAMVPVANIQCQTNNMLVNCNALGSYDVDGTPLKYLFDYSDGFTEENYTGISSHAYMSAGLYSVKVFVTDTFGNTSSAQTTVMPTLPPNQLPGGNIYCSSDLAPLTLYCWANTAWDLDGTIVSYQYTFDDSYSESTAPGGTIIHQLSAGAHKVSLMVTDNDGGQSTFEGIFTVNENHAPVVSILCNANTPQQLSCWSPNSYDPDQGDAIVNYKWEVSYNGNVDYSSEGILNNSFTQVFSHTGDVQVKFQAIDKFGAIGEVVTTYSLKENQAPLANINCFITAGTTYQCNANAYDPDGAIAESVWTIEGQTFSGASALYEFTNGGDKIISLKVTDNLGKSAVFETTVHIEKPKANLSCINVTNYKVRCDSSMSAPMNAEDQLSHTIIFGEEFLQNASVAEYEFQTSGEKIIKLIVRDSQGNKSETEVHLNILPQYSLPKASFVEHVEMSRVVNFDASMSLDQDRGVSKYEWDFGDGTQTVSADPKVVHNFHDYTYYNVTLKVTDNTGSQNVFSKQIFVNDPQVVDPGEQGKVDIIGIDSDNDGIRDDVQRWIQLEAKDNTIKRKYLRAIALVYEENFQNLNTLSNITNNFSKLNKLSQCLRLVETDPARADLNSRIFKVAYGNTNDRFVALNTIDASFAGQAIDSDMSDADLKTYCEALP